ncbi:GAF domain-containing protein [Leptolyngbya sp. NK1-12]|uniref:Circadian input-output histidine kinase CikA n=1 Tax=Leptolyngbya sp. NK1-12 TaxID=2547451 RepID=A0AA97AGA5_9CYAN|nr:GAF domain-containing protein [Leptolyngbya sp. NK1-12]
MDQAHHLSSNQISSKESILIIDDTPANLRRLASLLAEAGYHVRFASSLDFAIKVAQTGWPDLILLSIQLAELDSYHICRWLKADQQTHNVPVIFLAQSGTSFDKANLFASGGVDYVTYPFTAEEVLLKIETQLVPRRLQNQIQTRTIQLQQEIRRREQAEQALEQYLPKLLLLQQVTEAIRSPTVDQLIFQTIVEQIGRGLQVNYCSIHIYVPPPIPEILLIADYTEPNQITTEAIDLILQEREFIATVLSQDQAVVCADLASDERFRTFQPSGHLAQIPSLVAIRTSAQNQANGILLLQCNQQRVWTIDEILLLETMAAQIGMALAQAKSVEQEQKQLEALAYQNSLLRQEIRERRQIEMILQASEAELRSLFAAMIDVILVLDCQGRYLEIAPTSQENLYRPASALLGKTLHEVFPKNQADRFLSYIRSSLEMQHAVDCEYRLVIQGQEVWFNAKISPSGPDTVLWVARDITARKRAETELLHKSAALGKFSNHLKQLHRLSLTDFETIEALCADYLKTGCELLGFCWSAVGQRTQNACRLLAVYSTLPTADGATADGKRMPLTPGLEFTWQTIYCDVVLQRQQTVCYEHVSQIEAMRHHPMYQTFKLESYIGTPIWVDGEIYGILSFFSTQVRTQGFNQHEREIIELMAQSIGKFISGHQVQAKRQQAEEEVQLLFNVTQAITAAPDFNRALYAAVRILCEATGWIYGEVWLPSADGRVLERSPVWYCNAAAHSPTAVASMQRLRQCSEKVTFQPNEGIAGRVWSQQQPEWTFDEAPEEVISDTNSHSQYRFQLVNHYGVKARLGVPITVTYERSGLAQTETSQAKHPGVASSVVQAANGSTVLAVLVFFTTEARKQEQRLIQLVSAVAAQLGTVLAQKQAEAELKALFTAMDEVVLVRDVTGRCLKVASANPNFDYPSADLLGKTLHETLPQPLADQFLQGIRSSLATGKTVRLEYMLQLPHQVADRDGQRGGHRDVWLAASISPLSDESVLIVARDISDRKRIEAALEKARDAAEAANRAKTQFLANMSHELRTPLNSILGFTQLISQDTRLNPEQQEYLNIINRSGQHLLELINDVLEVARLEADRGRLQASLFDLYTLIGNIEEMLRLTALEKQLELTVAIAPEVPRQVIADKSKLRQVLLNLLDNAIKFTQAGRVSLQVGLGNEPSSSTASSALHGPNHEPTSPRQWLHFAVADTGFGIAAEEMDCLFEAFVQTEAGRQSNQGTGLGLVISRRFVDLMGGKLQVQSILGAGSVFEFTIPVHLKTQDLSLPTRLRAGDPSIDVEPSGVDYLYEGLYEGTNQSLVYQVSASDLEVMPPEWIASLCQAASGCSDRQVLQLIEQIPAAHSNLARGLKELVYHFQFEEIVELIKFKPQ